MDINKHKMVSIEMRINTLPISTGKGVCNSLKAMEELIQLVTSE